MPLDIVVCIKQVPHPEHFHEITLEPVTNRIRREGIPAVINPLDRNAIEEGLKIRERFSGKVTVLTMGPPKAREALEEALAMGADEAILLCDMAFAGADTLATAYALSAAIRQMCHYDLILCGNETIDSGTSQVAPQVAEILDIPHVTEVKRIEFAEDRVILAKRALEYGYMKVRVTLPTVLAVTKELNRPRLPTAIGIMEAAKKELKVYSLADLEEPAEKVGLLGSPTQILDVFEFKSARRGEMLQGLPEEMAKLAVRRLREIGAI